MVIVTARAAETLPTGEYLGQLVDIEQVEGQFGPQFHLVFEIVAPKQYAGVQRQAWASVSDSLNSKFMRWTTALINRQIAPGEIIDTDLLVGRQCILVIVAETRDDGSEYNKIQALKPWKKQAPQASVKNEPEDVVDEEFEDEVDEFGPDPFANE